MYEGSKTTSQLQPNCIWADSYGYQCFTEVIFKLQIIIVIVIYIIIVFVIVIIIIIFLCLVPVYNTIVVPLLKDYPDAFYICDKHGNSVSQLLSTLHRYMLRAYEGGSDSTSSDTGSDSKVNYDDDKQQFRLNIRTDR
jgi:hypothetical protein